MDEFNTITQSDVDVKCFRDGSIEWGCGKQRTFGGRDAYGYLITSTGGRGFKVHRLLARAFLSDYSEDLQVDHINGVKDDNRIENLRMRTNQENTKGGRCRKKKGASIYRGVYIHKRLKRWVASINDNDGKRKYLGLFTTEVDAALARDDAAFSHGYPIEGLNFPKLYI